MKVLDILNAPWAIVPEKYLEIREIYFRHLEGVAVDLDAIEARLGMPLENEPAPYTVEDGVGIVPIEGVIAKRMDLFSRISGGVSTQTVARNFKAALADPAVKAILLNVDSPGGEVDGTQELAQLIYQSHGSKPIFAMADGFMASAAYWIGSAAERVYLASKTTGVGSIGVIATHTDVSKANEMRGIKVTHITAGKYKAVGSPYQPLDRESEDVIASEVNQIYGLFVEDVATHRGASVEKVLTDMADGRIFIGQKGVDAGLADGIRSREEVLAELRQEAVRRQANQVRQVMNANRS